MRFQFYSSRCLPGAADPSMDDIFRLRHDVYCMERSFISPEALLDGMERDGYDHCATHFGAYSVEGALVGSVRLVTPDGAAPFPFENHCTLFDGLDLPPRGQCAEVSRLVVRRSHRRRWAKSPASGRGCDADSTLDMVSPVLLLGLYREMYRHSRRHSVRFWYAAMERALASSLESMGFRFEAIGPPANYYGTITPYIADLDVLLPQLAEFNPSLGAWFEEPHGSL